VVIDTLCSVPLDLEMVASLVISDIAGSCILTTHLGLMLIHSVGKSS
jgi:hypothetical protein